MAANERIELPPARREGNLSVERSLWVRRSVRAFTEKGLQLSDLGQLLWSAQGVNRTSGEGRTTPSAGGSYPLSAHAVVGKEPGVGELEPGLYLYDPAGHSIERTLDGDLREELCAACLNQRFIAAAPVTIVIAANYKRITMYYGDRGVRYAHMEAGHAGENVWLQAVALGLAAVAVGAFDDKAVSKVTHLPADLEPVYLLPVGQPRRRS